VTEIFPLRLLCVCYPGGKSGSQHTRRSFHSFTESNEFHLQASVCALHTRRPKTPKTEVLKCPENYALLASFGYLVIGGFPLQINILLPNKKQKNNLRTFCERSL